MKEIGLALLSGLIVGMVFKFVKLPIPAPPLLSGVMAILGVWLGATMIDVIMGKIQG